MRREAIVLFPLSLLIMPHFGLMDEKALGPVEGPLLRSRLHIRGAVKRFHMGEISLGLITMYDAMICAMEWFFALPERKKKLKIKDGDNLKDDKTMYRILTDSGVLDGSFDYEAFDSLIGKALKQEMSSFDYHKFLSDIGSVMTQLGVMPYDENKLPAEKPTSE